VNFLIKSIICIHNICIDSFLQTADLETGSTGTKALQEQKGTSRSVKYQMRNLALLSL
jgi:hypothetical protein